MPVIVVLISLLYHMQILLCALPSIEAIWNQRSKTIASHWELCCPLQNGRPDICMHQHDLGRVLVEFWQRTTGFT